MLISQLTKTFSITTFVVIFRIHLIIFLTLLCGHSKTQGIIPSSEDIIDRNGAIERFDTINPIIYLVFTGGDYNDGGKSIYRTLKRKDVPAHFFFTGDFYRNPKNHRLIKKFSKQGHYLGPHSDKHLLYAPWSNRDSLLVTRDSFMIDLSNNYKAMARFGISMDDALFFMPPYEWYNLTIVEWTKAFGSILINYTPGTRSNADYTTPDMPSYMSSRKIFDSILNYEQSSSNGLNGFILLLHIGTHPDRTDKMYFLLPDLIDILRERGYRFGSLN